MFEILKEMQTDNGVKLSLSPFPPSQNQPKCITCEVTESQYERAKVIQSETSAKLPCQEVSRKFQEGMKSLYEEFCQEMEKSKKPQAREQFFFGAQPKDVFDMQLNGLKAEYEKPEELKANEDALRMWEKLRKKIIGEYTEKVNKLVAERNKQVEEPAAEPPADAPRLPAQQVRASPTISP